MQGTSYADKAQRMVYNGMDRMISDRTYNFAIGATVVYGVILNAVICRYLTPFFLGMNRFVLLIGYLLCSFAGTFITYRSNNVSVSFLGYNLVVLPVGAVLSTFVAWYSPDLVYHAFVITAAVTLTMMAAATFFPNLFAGMGRMLWVALLGLFAAQLVCMLFRIRPGVISWIAAIIFSLYIGYDWVKAQMYIKTLDNAVDSALDIYIDIINLFMQVLSIIGISNDRES